MPWKRIGPKVYKLKGGRWILHQTCESATAAEHALNLHRGRKHGFKPTGGPPKKRVNLPGKTPKKYQKMKVYRKGGKK